MTRLLFAAAALLAAVPIAHANPATDKAKADHAEAIKECKALSAKTTEPTPGVVVVRSAEAEQKACIKRVDEYLAKALKGAKK